MHPLEEVVRAKSFMGESEVDSLNFKSGKSRCFSNGVASDAGVTSHSCEHLSGFDEVFVWSVGRGCRGRKSMLVSESFGEWLGVDLVGRHAHVEPRTRTRFSSAEEHLFKIWGVKHRSHVGERGP